ncbi:hypothetical protein [Frigoriglobus tundricola]|uniref:Uncharacterized protein n=1 Tax=Frigoriglobus tundricola TaxID=2774151 RepID=A0A6M5YFR2_9BACT|nr:hypothetical protein [Frigoriglobus tundricola]QJW92835.1 hypothetical protein FTUN_0332 [Frigoriglobus tundricola]
MSHSQLRTLKVVSVRRTLLALLLVLCAASLGCGGRGERGKNNDYDRPTTQKK